jgi:hypothetical protein
VRGAEAVLCCAVLCCALDCVPQDDNFQRAFDLGRGTGEPFSA